MLIIRTPSEMNEWSVGQCAAGNTIGFVPTMGALHQGHVELMQKSARENNFTTASIFVNPLQFNNQNDLATYPRQFDQDAKIAKDAGVDVLYAPTVNAMYPEGFTTNISVGEIANSMEGLHRPGHFDAVATVVVKLLNIVAPHVAYFGEKDFQQLAVIRHVVRDLDIPSTIVGVPTIRAIDGLALSSRNVRLTPEHLQQAPIIYLLLQQLVQSAHSVNNETLKLTSHFTEMIQSSSDARVEYVEIVNAKTLLPVSHADNTAVVCVAVWFGDVRLIDNISLVSNIA